jgi:hypothetical protein
MVSTLIKNKSSQNFNKKIINVRSSLYTLLSDKKTNILKVKGKEIIFVKYYNPNTENISEIIVNLHNNSAKSALSKIEGIVRILPDGVDKTTLL